MLLFYLAAINALTFFMFGWDKYVAERGGWRISESSLLMLSFLGGTPAAFMAMPFFRHKTRKGSFRVKFMLMVVLQVCTVSYLMVSGEWRQLEISL